MPAAFTHRLRLSFFIKAWAAPLLFSVPLKVWTHSGRMHRPRHRMGGVRMAGAGPDPPRGFAGFERMTKCGGEEKKNKKVPLAEHKDVTGKDRSSSGAPCRISATLSVRELWEKKRKKRKREKKEKRAAHIFSSRRLLFVLANFFETNPLSCFAHYSHFDKITTLETV